MSEDVRRGLTTAIVVTVMALVGGVSLEGALAVSGVAFFAGAIVGWGLDRVFGQPRRAVVDTPRVRGA